VDVTFAQRSLNRARRALAEAQGRRLADVVRLYMATGADWRSLKTTVAAR
jgi:outer membrane protein TolC